MVPDSDLRYHMTISVKRLPSLQVTMSIILIYEKMTIWLPSQCKQERKLEKAAILLLCMHLNCVQWGSLLLIKLFCCIWTFSVVLLLDGAVTTSPLQWVMPIQDIAESGRENLLL